ncbi:MAG: AAA family ATPase [Saprospiraceae bacterium]|nr:AAA family ATPase [Saprospiraceae bacterium]MCB9323936.1 AAA family ATPase [Lewinellaceae bacterium]
MMTPKDIIEPNRYDIRLDEIRLQNFRGFTSLQLNFHERLTAIIGDNGAGKSTILDVISEHLRFFLQHILLDDSPKSNFKKSDIKNGTLISNTKANFLLTYPKFEEEENENNNQVPENEPDFFNRQITATSIIGLNINKIEKEGTSFLPNIKKELSHASKKELSNESLDAFTAFYIDFHKSFRNDGEDSLPILVYYGGNSINTNFEDSTSDFLMDDRFKEIYRGSLIPGRFTFNDFFDWYNRRYKVGLITQIQYEIDLINNAIIEVFSDTEQYFKNLRIDYHTSYEALVIDKVILKDSHFEKETIDISQMSSGEKNLFALVSDLAMRLITANPKLKGMSGVTDNNPLLQGKGIVLIDEIDLHLHPKWQSKILPKLMDLFPKVQFIITTHSPIVLQGVNGIIYRLNAGNLTKIPPLGGWKIEQILSHLGLKQHYGKKYLELVDEFYDACKIKDIIGAENSFNMIHLLLPDESTFRIILKNRLETLKESW